MLKRKMFDRLLEWKASQRERRQQECLLIKGARQVGKSFVVDLFGRSEYSSYISLNFLENPEYKNIFEGSLSATDIFRQISLLVPGARVIPEDTLLFLDEIQQCPKARTALKFLAQDNRADVIASGSLLGLQFTSEELADRDFSIPVGYEKQIEMRPLDFEEYLWAKGIDQDALSLIRERFETCEAVPGTVNNAMIGHLREYLAVGGMPAVVQRLVDTDNYQEVFAEQQKILASYKDDIARYAKPTDRVKARACYESLPRQLAKENTKFQYSLVEKGGSARKFTSALDWLIDAAIVLPCRSVSTPRFPLAAYESNDRFRVYANDTGLLCAMYGFEMMSAVINDTLHGPMKGGLYENLIASMLVANGNSLRYWISPDANREIEFLLERDASVVPIEVKAKKGASASLDRMLQEDEVKLGYKLTSGNAGKSGKKITLPLYMAAYL